MVRQDLDDSTPFCLTWYNSVLCICITSLGRKLRVLFKMINLPLELSIAIISYLNFGDLIVLQRTSKFWRNILSNRLNWQSSTLVIGHASIIGSKDNNCVALDDYNCLDLQGWLNVVKFMTLGRIRTFCDGDADLLFPYLRNLQRIELKGSGITDSSITLLANSCPRLISLNIAKCYNLTEKSLISIGKLMQLEALDISFNNCVSNKSWLILCVFSRNLKSVVMQNCMYCEWDIVGAILPKNLKIWDISRNFGVGIEVLKTILKTKAMGGEQFNLTLKVNDCDMLTRDEISDLEKKCPEGSTLHIKGNARLKNNSAEGVREYLSMLISA